MSYRKTPREPRQQERADRAPVPPISAGALGRFGGRILSSDKARTHDGGRVNPTAYVGDELLVQGSSDDTALEALVEAAKSTGHDITGVSPDRRRYVDQLGEEAIAELASRLWVARYRIEQGSGSGSPAPDAWTVLQTYRGLVGEAPTATVGLNHLVTLTGGSITGTPFVEGPGLGGAPFVEGPGLGGAPFVEGPGTGGVPFVEGPGTGGTPFVEGPATSSYSRPGLGGRVPVTWLGRAPSPRRPDTAGRRAVVAVLDTGLGEHDWLVPPFVTSDARVSGHRIGLPDHVPNAELTGVGDPLEGDLDRDAGHGTFIAGIIRQTCPDARVLAVRVMPSDGVIDEHQLTAALNMLLIRQATAQLTGDAQDIIDVLSLSLGYYHETPQDVEYSSALGGTLRSFGELGVLTVAAAGNDHTLTPFFPAALASPRHGGGTRADAVPVLSVGALNPDGSTALFSNAGDWVTCHRPGANVVSTLPVTFDGSMQPSMATPDGRETIDPDNYASGFGIWSGTSFAAPVLAAELAQALMDTGSLDDLDAESAVERAWTAIETETDWRRP